MSRDRKQGHIFEFEADKGPPLYRATISDLSTAPDFDLSFIYLAISTSTDVIDFRFGEGLLNFPVDIGSSYFANVFALGDGLMEAGNFGLKIEAVPIPTTLFLLGSGLIASIGLRRKFRKN